MPPNPTRHIKMKRADNVRIGPVSVITLIIVVCMAVMGVLAISTSQATQTISDRQAEATQRLYINERAGQEFVAGVNGALYAVRASGGSASDGVRAVNAALDGICDRARAAVDDRVDCTAAVNDTTVTAEFICEDTRMLNITITIRSDATYRIDEWRMTSSQQGSASTGVLWTG